MNYGIVVVIFIIILGSVGIYFAYRFLQKRKKVAQMQRDAPDEVLDRFNQAEQNLKGGLKEDGTTKSPYKILWEIARGKYKQGDAGTDEEPIRTEQTIDDRELHKQPVGRQDIPVRDASIVSKDKPVTGKFKRNNLRSVISNIRRRRPTTGNA